MMDVRADVQNLEKNYRDYQFRVTHLDPVIEPDQREKSRITAQMQKEPATSHGCVLCCRLLVMIDCWCNISAGD